MPTLSPRSSTAGWCFLVCLVFPVGLVAEDDTQRQFFESKIRPVLVEHCYECHGPKQVKGNLRLDVAAGILRGGDSGPALVAGKPDESLIVEALRYESFEMPPSGRLSAQVVADFRKWIADGAWDPRDGDPGAPTRASGIDWDAGRQHWAFQPLPTIEQAMASVPKSPTSWSESAVDSFLESRLRSIEIEPPGQPLAPNPDAPARTLVRRLYFDLTGLPPTPAQQLEGVKLVGDGQMHKLVDDLLESTQFGVHWGRHWLDVARYADSNGGDFNATFHNAWRYRNYVVDAYNNDKPFADFVREQIAGDLLTADSPEQRTEQLVATGFLMLGTKMLSERDKRKLSMDVADEQVNTVGAAFLGMTLGCARCHDHKFDPIPSKDYYALAGIFLNTRTLHGESQKYVSTWERVKLPAAPEHVAAVESYNKRTKALQDAVKQLEKDLKAAKADVSDRSHSLLVDDADAKTSGSWKSSTYKSPYVGKGYIHDNREGKGEKSVEFQLAKFKPGKYELQFSYPPHNTHAKQLPVDVVIGEVTTRCNVDETKKPEIEGRYTSLGEFELPADAMVKVRVSTSGTVGYVIVDSVRFQRLDQDATSDEEPQLAAAKAKLDSLQQELESTQAKLKALNDDKPEPLPEAIAVADESAAKDWEQCIRGDHNNLGEVAPRGFLQVLPGNDASFDEQSSGRRQLADWLVAADNPLPARVYVNRVWQHVFGQGLVRTVDNFGALGESPSHPELLDYLAARFRAPVERQGWGGSTKMLIRELVLSHAYRISAAHSELAWNADPENRLLARAHRRRLSAESIRDSMLSLAGDLELAAGGTPVPGLGTLVTNNNADAKQYEGKSTSLRSMYLPIIRNELPKLLTIFDFADPDLVVGRRPVTNVPAQALMLLNSPFVMDCAAKTAARIPSSDSDVPTWIDETYSLVLCREPTEKERQRAVEFVLSAESEDARPKQLERYIHVLFASTEFRMLE